MERFLFYFRETIPHKKKKYSQAMKNKKEHVSHEIAQAPAVRGHIFPMRQFDLMLQGSFSPQLPCEVQELIDQTIERRPPGARIVDKKSCVNE